MSPKVALNLNITRYVDTGEPKPEIDLKAVCANIKTLDIAVKQAKQELLDRSKLTCQKSW